MKKNSLITDGIRIIRILDIDSDKYLCIDCLKRDMPKWSHDIQSFKECTEEYLLQHADVQIQSVNDLSAEDKKYAYGHYTMISGILPVIQKKSERNLAIERAAGYFSVSKQTIRRNLCLYLAFNSIAALAPQKCIQEKELSDDEKNMRWALNKFFYTKNKNSLQTAYTFMLKEKYCDKTGQLMSVYPSIHQFKYFYRKYNSKQKYYISRNGIKDYQRNYRPLIGDGIQAFAETVGVGLFDSTICDIYLVNDSGEVVGRPILTACVDAYSSLCCGYVLSWSGGVESLRYLLTNIICDKKELCKKLGIIIEKEEWDFSGFLPGVFVTDMGGEYKSENLEQITELGITVMNLTAYRPELKGSIEKFFDLIQSMYKPYLKNKGVIEPDFMERGSHDYRKDACLTIEDFEKIIVRCILYYNTKRIVENFPYTKEMYENHVKPYANCIWNWGKQQCGANLISVTQEQLRFVMLPRTIGTFSRNGLKVNKLRYHCDGYTEQYLSGGKVTVAYHPDDVSVVWIVDKGKYIAFHLIESRFLGDTLEDANTLKINYKRMIHDEKEANAQSKIDLAFQIQAVAENRTGAQTHDIKSLRATKQKEKIRHI